MSSVIVKHQTETYRFSNPSAVKYLALICPVLARGQRFAIYANKEDREKLNELFGERIRLELKGLSIKPLALNWEHAVKAGRGLNLGGVILFDAGNELITETMTESLKLSLNSSEDAVMSVIYKPKERK